MSVDSASTVQAEVQLAIVSHALKNVDFVLRIVAVFQVVERRALSHRYVPVWHT